MKAIRKVLGRFEFGMANVGAGICLFLMMLITVLSVFGRYVLEVDLVGGAFNMVERILFPLMVFWAMPLAYRDGAFPKLEVIVKLMPIRLRAASGVLVTGVELVIFFTLIYYTGVFAFDGIASRLTAPIGANYWPIYPVLAMVPLAFGLMIIEMLNLLFADLISLISGIEKTIEEEAGNATLD